MPAHGTAGGSPPTLVPHGDRQLAGLDERLALKRCFLWAIGVFDRVRRGFTNSRGHGENLLCSRPDVGEPPSKRIPECGERIGKRHQLNMKPPGVKRRCGYSKERRIVDWSALPQNLVEQIGQQPVEIWRRTTGDGTLQVGQCRLGAPSRFNGPIWLESQGLMEVG